MADSLAQIDAEITAVYGAAVSGSLSAGELAIAARPLLHYCRQGPARSRPAAYLTCCSLVALLAAGLAAYCDPVHRAVCAVSRLGAIQLLPYWDWTRYYGDECLVSNPFYRDTQHQLFTDDCEVCESVDSVARVAVVSQSVMSDSFIKRDIPVIVTDATPSWPAASLFSLSFLHQLYNSETALRQTPPCSFATNLRQRQLNIHSLLGRAHTGQLTGWYAHWETCDRAAVRVMRRFYRRPYFLPAMVESVGSSWLFVSADYTAKLYKPAPLRSPLMWLAQLRGSNRIRLVPHTPCNSTCSTLYAVLRAGDTVVWTDFMWSLDYLPQNDGDQQQQQSVNIALGSGGLFD